MITRTQLSLAVALSLTVTSTWAATETTVCEVWRITDGTPLVTSDGRPVLTKQCKTVPIVAAPTPIKSEPTASTAVVVESPAEPEPESTAQAAETAEPVAEPTPAAQASVAIVEEAAIEEPAAAEPAQEAAVEPVAETVTEAVAEPAPEPAVVVYQFKNYQTTILFDTDKSNLDADDIGSLEQLAMASSTGDIVRVHLTGHADSRGTDAYNMSLSERRIQAVVSFLADLNIMVTSFFAQGETAPVLVDGKEDLDLSRRVHVEVKTRSK